MEPQAHEAAPLPVDPAMAALAERVRKPAPAEDERGAVIATIHVDPTSKPTTAATEDDDLQWVEADGDIRKASLILHSPEWELLMACIRAWSDHDGTSKRSCLLPEYLGAFDDGQGRQPAGSAPVPFADETFLRASLENFAKSSPVARRQVLIVLTSRMRRFFVDLREPVDTRNPGGERRISVTCSMEGQTPKLQAYWARFAFRGPQIAVAAAKYGPTIAGSDAYAYSADKRARNGDPLLQDKSVWVPERKVIASRQGFDAFGGFDPMGNDKTRQEALKKLDDIAGRPEMLRRRFYR